MAYIGNELNTVFTVGKLYSIHYFEYMSTFAFEGESHDFWEFVYVDKGEINITAGTRNIVLKKGEVIFHEPNEFHNVKATGDIAPNLVVVAFECTSEAMQFFRRRILKLDDMERTLLANIIVEARHCFDCRLDNPYLQNMPKKEQEDFTGSEQLIRLYLEQFLIFLTRHQLSMTPSDTVSDSRAIKATKIRNDMEIFRRVIEYMEANLSEKLTIQKICRDNLVSRSQLQKLIMQHRIFFPFKNSRSQGNDSHAEDEFHPDFGYTRVFIYPLFLQTIQKNNRHDSVRLYLFYQGNV